MPHYLLISDTFAPFPVSVCFPCSESLSGLKAKVCRAPSRALTRTVLRIYGSGEFPLETAASLGPCVLTGRLGPLSSECVQQMEAGCGFIHADMRSEAAASVPAAPRRHATARTLGMANIPRLHLQGRRRRGECFFLRCCFFFNGVFYVPPLTLRSR